MTYETPLKITAWHVETDKFRIRRLGKALEELGELASVLARCIIQGVDEVDPSSGEVNRMRMQKEGADVYTQLAHLVDAFDLDQSDMLTRIRYKTDSMATWERLLEEENILSGAERMTDKGYEIGTLEDYQAFAKKRQESIERNK